MLNKYLGIDISDDFIRYVYLKSGPFSNTILKAGKAKIDFDILSPRALCQSIKSLIKEEQVKPTRIFVSISRKDTVIHQLTLPKLTKREFETVVTSEIEKIPAFHKREYDYIYRKYPLGRDKFRVILAAIRRDILDAVLREIHRTGIPFEHVELTPLNFRDVTNKIDHVYDCDACVVVSDRQTYLSIYDTHQYKNFYIMPAGLNQFQHTVSQEQIKMIANDWASQLKRALKAYLLDNRTIRINKIWLVWDKEVAPNLDQYLADEFDNPVEILDVRKIPKIKTTENYPLNPIYATALSPISGYIHKIKPQFNLQHFFSRFQMTRHALKAGAVAALIIAFFGIFFNEGNRWLNEQTKQYVLQSRAAEGKTRFLKGEAQELYAQHREYDAIRQRFLAQATYVQQLNRVSWAQVFAVVANELPEELALKSFRFNEEGRATIKGQALKMESIAEMIRRIDDSAILDKGKFDFLKEGEVADQKILNFGILAKLKEDAPRESDTDEQEEN